MITNFLNTYANALVYVGVGVLLMALIAGLVFIGRAILGHRVE